MPINLSKPPSVSKLLILFCVILLLAFWLTLEGCTQTPTIYVMNPTALEAVRSEISTVGVSLSPELSETEVLFPAKGVWGGIKRGIVFGAALPVMLGFASPVPGGTYIGLLASPLGAIVGGIYGVSTAVPVEAVEHAQAMLEIATEDLRQMKLREEFVNCIIDLGNAQTAIEFVAWPANAISERSYLELDFIDARLVIRAEKTGLRGNYSINPPMDTFMRIHAQLIRSEDNGILLDEHFTCASDEERTFEDWADHGGIDLVNEFKACVPELAEKIVDDFFRVYPLEWSGGDTD